MVGSVLISNDSVSLTLPVRDQTDGFADSKALTWFKAEYDRIIQHTTLIAEFIRVPA
jgi:hypothetical protein